MGKFTGASGSTYVPFSRLISSGMGLRPDLPFRRQQAQRGLAVGTADVLKAQQENVYDVSRMYYTYVYATQQEQTASEIVEQMESLPPLTQSHAQPLPKRVAAAAANFS